MARHVSVQVKSPRGGSWQFGNITTTVTSRSRESRQLVGKPKTLPACVGLAMVFVVIAKTETTGSYIRNVAEAA